MSGQPIIMKFLDVIHTVSSMTGKSDELRQCYKSCLELMMQYTLKTIVSRIEVIFKVMLGFQYIFCVKRYFLV